MKTFEYIHSFSYEDLEHRLNDYGSDGWEVIYLKKEYVPSSPNVFWEIVFKKEIINQHES